MVSLKTQKPGARPAIQAPSTAERVGEPKESKAFATKKLAEIDRRITRTDHQIDALEGKLEGINQTVLGAAAKLGEALGEVAGLNIRIGAKKRLQHRLEKEKGSTGAIVGEERGRLQRHRSEILDKKLALLEALECAAKEDGAPSTRKGHRCDKLARLIAAEQSKLAGQEGEQADALRKILEAVEGTTGDGVKALAALVREKAVVKAEAKAAAEEVESLAKLMAELEGDDPPPRSAVIERLISAIATDEVSRAAAERRADEQREEMARYECERDTILAAIDLLEADQRARAEERRRWEDEIARIDAENAAARAKKERDTQDRAQRKQADENHARAKQARDDAESRAELHRLTAQAQVKVEALERQLAQLSKIKEESGKIGEAKKQEIDALAALLASEGAEARAIQAVFAEAAKSIGQVRTEWLDGRLDQQKDDVADAALAAAVAAFLRGMVAAAEHNSTAQVSIPSGIRVASEFVSGPDLGDLNALLAQLDKTSDHAEDARRDARHAVAWSLGHGLMPHPSDVAQLVTATPEGGRGWGDLFSSIGHELDRTRGRQYAHPQLRAGVEKERLELVRQEAKLLDAMGGPAIIAMLRDPKGTKLPEVPASIAGEKADVGRILDDLFGG